MFLLIRLLLPFSLPLIFSPIFAATDEFFMFNVGAGNSQFIRYALQSEQGAPQKYAGVLYDCGSSAAKEHFKFASRDALSPLFVEQGTSINTPLQSFSNTKMTMSDYSHIDYLVSSEQSQLASAMPRHLARSVIEGQTEAYASFIHEVLIERRLCHLFVLLSHPDRDHINFIFKPNVLPTNVPTTFILGGGWLEKLTTEVIQALQYIGQQAIKGLAVIDLPYYWNLPNYHDLRTKIYKGMNFDENSYREMFAGLTVPNVEDLRQFSLQDFVNKFLLTRLGINNNSEALNLLEQLSLDQNLKDQYDRAKLYIDHFAPMNNQSFLSHVIFWSINNLSGEYNSQSMVVSCTSINLNISFVLTGDAPDTLFQKINGIDIIRKIYGTNHVVFLVYPHHASNRNKSTKMLNLFRPDIIGISAGTGTNGHPRVEVKNHLTDYYKDKELKFWQRYQFAARINESWGMFFKTKKDTNDAIVHVVNQGSFPILNTNVEGTIKIDNNGIHNQPGDRYISINNVTYAVDFKGHKAHCNGLFSSIKCQNNKIYNLKPFIEDDVEYRYYESSDGEKLFVSEYSPNLIYLYSMQAITS